MRERPIIMKDHEVRAILEGRKTQTRRLIKPQPNECQQNNGRFIQFDGVMFRWRGNNKFGNFCGSGWRPYGLPGDRLWVRETWQEFFADELPEGRPTPVQGRMGIPATPERKSVVAYRADGEIPDHREFGKALWKPSIFMPKWASRILLEITGIRVERLQCITEGSAIAEGIQIKGDEGSTGHNGMFRDKFAEMWDIDHHVGSWDFNPWVWVTSFKRINNE